MKIMTEQQIGTYYLNLHNGEKGSFTAYLSLNLGGVRLIVGNRRCFYGRAILHTAQQYVLFCVR